jgi:hypothetical protein
VGFPLSFYCDDRFRDDRFRDDRFRDYGLRKQRESPRSLRSKGSLRASLASLVPVLTSPVFPERPAPFIPARIG